MKCLSLLLLLLLPYSVFSQHTFSMIAVDTVTNEVGSAGATCLAFYPVGELINRLVPGRGGITTQASVFTQNRDTALELMQLGYSPKEIIDSLQHHDYKMTPEFRQNMAIDIHNRTARVAAYTGDSCLVWAGHIKGINYVIAGNTLLGKRILDSMEKGFVTTRGTLADKLMAALQKAKIVGADSRCTQYNTSSLAGFLRICLPTDSVEKYSLDLEVSFPPFDVHEPIDSLQSMYNQWKKLNTGFRESIAPGIYNVRLSPNPAKDYTRLEFSLTKPEQLDISLFDAQGKFLHSENGNHFEAGIHQLFIPLQGLPGNAMYVLRINGMAMKIIKE